jgi:hypothetical protein
MTTYELDDFSLGETIGHTWVSGILFAIGYAGLLIEHGDLDGLALDVLNTVPGFAPDDAQPSPRLLDGLRAALDDAQGSGIIYWRRDREIPAPV